MKPVGELFNRFLKIKIFHYLSRNMESGLSLFSEKVFHRGFALKKKIEQVKTRVLNLPDFFGVPDFCTEIFNIFFNNNNKKTEKSEKTY